MNWEAVRTELAKPAYAERIAAGDWQGVADEWNARTATRRENVSKADLQNVLMQISKSGTSLWFVLRAIARDPSHPAYQLADAVVHTVQESLIPNINLDNPTVSATMDALVTAGLVTTAERQAIHALGDTPTSIAESTAGRRVDALDLYNAWVTRNG